jgi:hypothetical protein
MIFLFLKEYYFPFGGEVRDGTGSNSPRDQSRPSNPSHPEARRRNPRSHWLFPPLRRHRINSPPSPPVNPPLSPLLRSVLRICRGCCGTSRHGASECLLLPSSSAFRSCCFSSGSVVVHRASGCLCGSVCWAGDGVLMLEGSCHVVSLMCCATRAV